MTHHSNQSEDGAVRHTPGPWERGNTFATTVFGPDGEVVANATTHKHGEQKAIANARLIAAAPEMLTEMQTFCARVEAGEVRSKRTYAAFKALITKATS